tara:strand:+ start:125 stop:265 length:141 start_codon:yes stop_codon:yes gene_type:complete
MGIDLVKGKKVRRCVSHHLMLDSSQVGDVPIGDRFASAHCPRQVFA